MRNLRLALAAMIAATVTAVPSLVLAAPATLADLAEAVDFSDVSPAVIGVAAALLTLFVIIKGIRIVLGFTKGG